MLFEFVGEAGRGRRGFAEGVFLDGEAVVARGVEARFVDVVVVFFEVVGDTRQQDVRRVGAGDEQARRVFLNEADGVVFAVRQQVAGFGGDGGGGFAAKVGFGELRPKVFEGLRVAGELGFGLFARAVFAGVQAVLVVFELVPGLLVEVVEEAGAPGVPEAGVGGADVGEGQQVEVVEVVGAGDGRSVGGDGVGVGEVFFLRGQAVVEVVGDEPGEQGAVFGRDGVVFARVEVCDLRAGLAVVAVVAFADVVKEGGEVEDGGVLQAADEGGGFGVGGVRAHQTVKGFDEFEGVLVDGVLVEEVVLHAPGDVGEGGDIAVEQAVLVDARQLWVDGAGAGE